jgi:addiction module HigA family antidote
VNITKRKPLSPGELLDEEFMQPLGLTQDELARRTGVARRRINEIVRGRRGITPDTAVRFARAFGTTPEFWLNLQARYDLWTTLNDPKARSEYRRIKRIAA